MYQTYFFISRLSNRLNDLLKDSKIIECFSQEKDELVFVFYTKENTCFNLRIDLHQGRNLFSFPKEFSRTNQNSVDLFKDIIGENVISVRQTPEDRSFYIELKNQLSLFIKLHGVKSNIILFKDSSVLEIFNKNLKKDFQSISDIPENSNDSTTIESLTISSFNTQSGIITPKIWEEWVKLTEGLSLEQKQVVLKGFLFALQSGKMYLCQDEKEVILTFFQKEEILFESYDPIEISNQFSKYYWQFNQFNKKKTQLISLLNQKLFYIKTQIENCKKQLSGEESNSKYQEYADLLMAYGQNIPFGSNSVVYPRFLDNKPIEIKLKPELGMIENAERFYRKSKGHYLKLEELTKRRASWQEQYTTHLDSLEKLGLVQNWAGLKPFIANSVSNNFEETNLPYHIQFFSGYDIWVGKNAKSNDEMLRHAHKNDLWLHARDVAGSHVIIRNKNGTKVPKPVIERAGELAAFYSKAKTNALSPVMVTERKYVRKGKNMLPGQVKVEKEITILVTPKA